MKKVIAMVTLAFALALTTGCGTKTTCEKICSYEEECSDEYSATCVEDCDAALEGASAGCVDAADKYGDCVDGSSCLGAIGCLDEGLEWVAACIAG